MRLVLLAIVLTFAGAVCACGGSAAARIPGAPPGVPDEVTVTHADRSVTVCGTWSLRDAGAGVD